MIMNKILKLKTYLKSPTKCYIPICKARCCIDAPLPEDFLPKFKGRIQRPIYSAINIGQNDPRDTFNSIIYNTTPNPVQLVGFDQYGNKLMGIPKQVLEELQIKSMEQIDALINKYKDFHNYCPFITDIGKCSVYEHRPFICKEFGTAPGKINWCPDKSSRIDIVKYHIKGFIDFYAGLFKKLYSNIFGKAIKE